MTAGEKLYMEGHLEEALPMLRGETKEGDSRAWFFLGLAALYGIGDERENPAEGAARFRKGSAGDSLCLLFSAFFLPEGAVSAEGLRKAFLSAEGGEDGPAGLFAAACILRSGLSGAAEADLEKSRALFEQAAAAGFWQAEYELGLSLLNENEEADKVRGAALMKSAADKGAGMKQAMRKEKLIGEIFSLTDAGEKRIKKARRSSGERRPAREAPTPFSASVKKFSTAARKAKLSGTSWNRRGWDSRRRSISRESA